jgi:hypothetical protein
VPFTVLEPLSITGVSTTFGPAGSSVTISGTRANAKLQFCEFPWGNGDGQQLE